MFFVWVSFVWIVCVSGMLSMLLKVCVNVFLKLGVKVLVSFFSWCVRLVLLVIFILFGVMLLLLWCSSMLSRLFGEVVMCSWLFLVGGFICSWFCFIVIVSVSLGLCRCSCMWWLLSVRSLCWVFGLSESVWLSVFFSVWLVSLCSGCGS